MRITRLQRAGIDDAEMTGNIRYVSSSPRYLATAYRRFIA